MNERVRDVVVIGGGISGLTTAWHLKQAGVDVCLLEAASNVGGCTRTERRDGFLLEKGPFNLIVRDPAFEELLDALSDEVKVVAADRSARARLIYRRGRIWTVPTNPVSLVTTGLLSFGTKCRLLKGMLFSRRGGDAEETIEQVATRRFGREVSDTMISAVISGIFAGDIRRLSLRACFPTVARIDREARSLIVYGVSAAFRAKRAGKGKPRRRWRGLVSIDGGLGALTTALGRPLGADLISDSRAESIREIADGYEVTFRHGDETGNVLRCRDLVIASSASEAGRLLDPIMAAPAKSLAQIESSSLVVLSIGFRKSDVGHPMKGFGFLKPHDETGFPLMGVLWADSIFPQYAPADHRLIRVFIGGATNPDAVALSDNDLIATATDSVRDLLQVSGDPVLTDICRYPAAIPQYHFGHSERIEGVRAAVAAKPGLHLVGNYLEGVSLNDCVRVGKRVALQIKDRNASGGSVQPEMAIGVR